MKSALLGIIIYGFIIFSLLLVIKYKDPFFDLFRLSGSNNISDYKNADQDDAVDWLMRMCDDGKCLNKIDWKCGFTNGSMFEVNECFIESSTSAKLWVSLDSIRKYCGKKHAEKTDLFTFGPNGISPESCANEGGDWQQISTIVDIPKN